MDPDIFVKTNILGTNALLRSALSHKVKRFHHVSTDEVFGSFPLDSSELWTESSPYSPRSPYSASKAASDHLVRAYFHTFKLPVTVSNCTNNIGPFCFPEKFVPLAITNLLEGKKIPIYTPGNQVREWLYVEDHCSAIESILLRGQAGETYFVGPEHEEINNLELAKKILEFMGKDESFLELVKDRPAHDQRYALDISKIKRELGWQPKYSLDQSLEATIKWYQENEQWWKRVKSGEYQKYYEAQYVKR